MSQNEDMMNCDEYKQAVAADPAFDGATEHLAGCSECQAYRADMQSLNLKIAKALQIAAPELVVPELPSIDSDNVVTLAGKRAPGRMAWFAIAATVVLAAFVGFRVFDSNVPAAGLEEQLLAHLDHEKYALKVSSKAVSEQRLERIVPAHLATMSHEAGLITYAQSCRINGNDVPHLVIQGERGPITILLMPKEMVEHASSIDGEGVQGVILPVGNGSIAIIGERDEPLENVKRSILDSVKWGTST